jgi:hypothetical protein
MPFLFPKGRFKERFELSLFFKVDRGIVKKSSCVIIFWLTPELNSLTCFLMYLRKALLDHLPNSIILNTGIPARYIAIAAPLLAV